MREKGQRFEQRQRGNEAADTKRLFQMAEAAVGKTGTNSGKIASRDSGEPGALQGEERERSTRSGRQSGSTAWKIRKPRLPILCDQTLCS